MSSVQRPLSPHLSIYKPQITSVLSILHRITGVALYAGTALLVAWLWTLAYGASDAQNALLTCIQSPLGQIVLIGWTGAFYFHLCNGIRHLFWDVGMGFSLASTTRSGWLVVLTASIMTFFTWNCIYSNTGLSL